MIRKCLHDYLIVNYVLNLDLEHFFVNERSKSYTGFIKNYISFTLLLIQNKMLLFQLREFFFSVTPFMSAQTSTANYFHPRISW